MRGDQNAEFEIETFAPALRQGHAASLLQSAWRRSLAPTALLVVMTLLCGSSASTAADARLHRQLLADRTGSALWFFDRDDLLTRVDLDQSRVVRFPIHSGLALFDMARSVAVFRGDDGTDVIAHDGTVTMRGVGRGVVPLTDPSTDTLWALGALDMVNSKGIRPWQWFQPPVSDPAASVELPDGGQPIAAAGPLLLVETRAANDATLDWVDPTSGKTQHVADTCALAANEHAVVTSTPCGTSRGVSVTDIINNGAPVRLDLPSGVVVRVTISPDGQFVAAVTKIGEGARIDMFDARTGALLHTRSGFAYQWAWTRDSRYLIIADPPRLIAWRAIDGLTIALPFEPIATAGLAVTN